MGFQGKEKMPTRAVIVGVEDGKQSANSEDVIVLMQVHHVNG